MYAKLCEWAGIWTLRLSTHDLSLPENGACGYVEVIPIDAIGELNPRVRMNLSFSQSVSCDDWASWCNVFMRANQIAHRESLMMFGEEGRLVIEAAGQLWSNVDKAMNKC